VAISDPNIPFVAGRKPQPGPGWAMLWVLFYLIITQIPGGLIATGILCWEILTNPAKALLMDELGPRKYLTSGQATLALVVGLGVAQVLSWIYAFVLLRRFHGQYWIQRIGLHYFKFSDLFCGLGLGFGLFFLAEGLSLLARHYIPQIPREGEAASMLAPWPWWSGILVIGLGPAIGEELFCRGFLGQGLVARMGSLYGLLFTSFLFGIMHVDPGQALYAAVLGMLLHALALFTGSLYGPIIAHFTNNSLTMLGVCHDSPLREGLETLETQIQANPWTSLTLGVFLSGLVLGALRFVFVKPQPINECFNPKELKNGL
jgi:membrane protease YdiL (CAAX protease family)